MHAYLIKDAKKNYFLKSLIILKNKYTLFKQVTKMPGFSKVLNPSSSLMRSSLLFFKKSVNNALRTKSSSSMKSLNSQCLISQVRESHGRTMFIRPGKFYTKKFFDIIVS